MFVTCPYCHKKLHIGLRLLLLKGRQTIVCPICGRRVYGAMRNQLMILQFLMCMLSISFCAWLGTVIELPGGAGGLLLMAALVVALTVAVNEVCCRWVARDARLQYWTDKKLEKERQEAAAQKKLARQAKKHKRKK